MARPQAPVGAPRTPLPSEDQRKRLEALRDLLEGRLDGASDRDMAAIAARYQSVLADLAALPVIEESNGIDDLSAARRRRRAAATGS